MRFLKALALICGLVAPAAANQYFNSPVTSTATGSAWQSISGQFYLAASSANVSTTTALIPTKSTWTITMDGATGKINATSVVATTIVASSYTAKINGSLIGDGSASGSALGVNGSSVPILNASGFVPNFQVDSSSIVKLSAGLIQNYQIDGSSIPKLSAGLIVNAQIDHSSVPFLSGGKINNWQIDSSSVNKVIGISSTCSSGQYLQSMVTNDGVAVGGTCVAAGAGDVTQAGNNVFTANNHLSTGTCVHFSPTLGFTSAEASFDGASVITGSTISYVARGSTQTCHISASISSNGSSNIRLGIAVDNNTTFLPGSSSTVGLTNQNNQGSGSVVNVFPTVTFQVTAGASHTYYLGLWSPAPNTETFPSSSLAEFCCDDTSYKYQ